MNKLGFITIVLTVFLAGVSVGQSSRSTAVEKEILRLTNEVSAASARLDRTHLAKLLDDRFVMTLASGKTYNKSDVLDLWTKSEPNVTNRSYVISDPKIYVFDDTAAVVAEITDKWRDKDGDHTYTERVFDVWIKARSGWRFVASKPTRMDVK